MSDYYHQFLTSMSGVAPNPHHMQQQQQQQQQQQHPPPHPHQPVPLHQPHHLPQQHPQPPAQHIHEMMPMPLSLPPHLHQQPAMSMGMGMGPGQGPNHYQSLGFYTGFPEPVMFNTQKSQRNRRKSAPGSEHIKHRRTRSGCYTCRTRRIKCDEKRPVCERCKKGKRDCSYPDPKSSKKSIAATGQSSSQEASNTSQQASPESSNEDDDDDADQDRKLDTILDDDEAEGSASGTADTLTPQQFTVTFNDKVRPPLRQSSSTSLLNMKRLATTGGTSAASPAGRRTRQGSETPSIEGKSTSPATSTGTAGSFSQTAQSVGSSEQYYSSSSNIPTISAADWSHLPQDLRFFLGYFMENITHLHYCLPTDSDNFIRGALPALAVRNEPLLYALVAFSAYHYILRDPAARLQQFLQYYDQSVKLLLGILKRKERHSLGTLLTILQLATIEEYLGDWVNLMGHKTAALEMLTQIYTPETAAHTSTSRMVLHWYSRFDVFIGIMGGFETALSRDWFTSIVEYYQNRIIGDPTNLICKVEDCSARLRLISLDMSLLFARAKEDDNNDGSNPATRAGGGGLAAFPSFAPDEAFMREHARILGALHAWKASLDAIVQVNDEHTDDMKDSAEERKHHPLLVTDFSHAVPLSEDDIVDPYQPGILYHEPLFGYTIMSCEWQSIIVMHELQAAQLAIAAMSATPQPAAGPSPFPQGTTLPEGMSLPRGMSLPEGMTLPEGMPFPAGMALPEVMSLPAGINLPEGMTLPEGMSLEEGLAAAAAMSGATGVSTGNTAVIQAAEAASATKSSAPPGGSAGESGAGGQIGAAQMSTQMSAGMAGLARRAYTICQIFETLELWPGSPPGCLIISQAMIAIAALFLPRDSRHHMWIRRKFALIETMGYIFPLTMRTRMSELFNDPSCVQWWLPNNKGFSPILQSVRAFADERNVTAVSAQTENLREVRHIFAKLQIGEGGGSGGSGGGAADDPDTGNRAGSSTSKPKKGAKAA